MNLEKRPPGISCLTIRLPQKLARYLDILKVFFKIRPVEGMSYTQNKFLIRRISAFFSVPKRVLSLRAPHLLQDTDVASVLLGVP